MLLETGSCFVSVFTYLTSLKYNLNVIRCDKHETPAEMRTNVEETKLFLWLSQINNQTPSVQLPLCGCA